MVIRVNRKKKAKPIQVICRGFASGVIILPFHNIYVDGCPFVKPEVAVSLCEVVEKALPVLRESRTEAKMVMVRGFVKAVVCP